MVHRRRSEIPLPLKKKKRQRKNVFLPRMFQLFALTRTQRRCRTGPQWVSQCAGAGGHFAQCHSKTSPIKGNTSGNLCTWQRHAAISLYEVKGSAHQDQRGLSHGSASARAPRTGRLLNFNQRSNTWVFLLRDWLLRVAPQVRRRPAELLTELEERNPRSPPFRLPSLPYASTFFLPLRTSVLIWRPNSDRDAARFRAALALSRNLKRDHSLPLPREVRNIISRRILDTFTHTLRFFSFSFIFEEGS